MPGHIPEEIENPMTLDPGVENPTTQGVYGYNHDDDEGDDSDD